MNTITFSVPGMTCGHCEAAVKKEVGAVTGVTGVEVDLETKDVTVTGTDLDRDKLVEAIDEAGYDVA
jgi:copper chaperone